MWGSAGSEAPCSFSLLPKYRPAPVDLDLVESRRRYFRPLRRAGVHHPHGAASSLTDLARANWDLHGIATFAGHRNVQTTLLYIHLSGRELAAQLAAGMNQIHAWRLDLLGKDAR